jgi:hypothetical protein
MIAQKLVILTKNIKVSDRRKSCGRPNILNWASALIKSVADVICAGSISTAKIPVLCLLLILLTGTLIFCQDTEPEEYQEDEFSPFLKELRRGEIIMLGSLPLSIFLAIETYEIYRYVQHDREPEYTPWPFRKYGGMPFSKEESTGIFVSALGFSFLIAVTDFIIGRFRGRGDGRKYSEPEAGD